MGGKHEWANLPDWLDRRYSVHFVVLWPPLIIAALGRDNSGGNLRSHSDRSRRNCDRFLPVDPRCRRRLRGLGRLADLDRIRAAIGFSTVSSSPTWRDASAVLAFASGLYLLLTAIVSFGVGGYVAGRLRERWHPGAHSDVVEFRDGVHGVLAWAVAVVITGLVAAASAASIASKSVEPATSPSATTGEPLIAYELDRLFRGDRRPIEGEIGYIRAEAGRILLKPTGRAGITPDDRRYLVALVAARTGIAPADAERRVDDAIVGAATAVHKARRSGVILGFSAAVALLLGAVAAWYASCVGGRLRDDVAPSLAWRWPQHA